MHAIILVGGRGTRLQPLTDTRPKPMMSLVDRSVVMRDGRVAYDGPPLTQEVAAHTHHAHDHDLPGGHDHVPHGASPLDFERRTQP